MSRANSISLKLVMKLPAEARFKFIKKHYPTMNIAYSFGLQCSYR